MRDREEREISGGERERGDESWRTGEKTTSTRKGLQEESHSPCPCRKTPSRRLNDQIVLFGIEPLSVATPLRVLAGLATINAPVRQERSKQHGVFTLSFPQRCCSSSQAPSGIFRHSPSSEYCEFCERCCPVSLNF